MKKQLLLISLLCIAVFNAVLAEPPSYIETENGIIVFTDPVFTGTSRAVKLENAAPSKSNPTLKTKSLTAIADLPTGAATFLDRNLRWKKNNPKHVVKLNINV